LDIKDFFSSVYTHLFAQDKVISFLGKRLSFSEEEIINMGKRMDQFSS